MRRFVARANYPFWAFVWVASTFAVAWWQVWAALIVSPAVLLLCSLMAWYTEMLSLPKDRFP